MAYTFCTSILCFPKINITTPINRFRCASSSSANSFMEFLCAPGPTKKLMAELLSSVEEKLGSTLQPTCTLPPNVQQFSNSTGDARGSLHIRSGLPSSQIDFITSGWIYCKLPNDADLNITSLSAYLTSSTDAPHFLIDLIQSTPTSVVLVLDLNPRKDLVLYPDYLKTYYEDTQLDKLRQRLHAIPEVRPYFSPSLYIRAVLSPTAILVSLDTEGRDSASIEDIIEDHIRPIAKELLHFWIDSCACYSRDVEASEKDYLVERDQIIKTRTIEIDLGSSLPRLFGQETTDRVLNALKIYYS